MAELLWNRRNEEHDEKVGWLAPKTIPDVHMETMGETKNEMPKSAKIGYFYFRVYNKLQLDLKVPFEMQGGL